MCFFFPLLTLTFIILTFSKGGEEHQKAAQEARENLKTLEGPKIGFADIAVGCQMLHKIRITPLK